MLASYPVGRRNPSADQPHELVDMKPLMEKLNELVNEEARTESSGHGPRIYQLVGHCGSGEAADLKFAANRGARAARCILASPPKKFRVLPNGNGSRSESHKRRST